MTTTLGEPTALPALPDPRTGEPGGSLRPTPPGASYTDPAVFAREQELVFERSWTCGPRVDGLARPGAFATVTVGRESVLVVRGRDGALRAFLNVCRHRGALLCLEEDGQVGRTLRCPYHAWAYGLDGSLVAAPNLVRMPDVDRGSLALVPVALREWLGYAWLCLADEPPSFETEVLAVAAEKLGGEDALAAWDVPGLALGHRERYEVAANWKLVVENFMECYHCASIHPELTDVLPEFARGWAAQTGEERGAAFGPRVEGFTVDGSASFEALPGLDEEHDRRYFAVTLAPTTFLNLVPDSAIVLRMTPFAVDRTVVECDWLFAPEVVASGADVRPAVELFHRVNLQDFDACERCQRGMGSRAYAAGGVLVPSEHHLGEFHRWLAARTGAGTP